MSSQNWSDNIITVDLYDDPDLTEELTSITEQVEKNPRSVVLNFSNLKFLNSSNISKLLKLRKEIVDVNRDLVLCAIPIQVWGVFLLTGLDTLFEVTEDVATALASIQIRH
jgi:anti-anti-sigma factor